MAQGDGVVYNDFKEQILKGVHNLASGGHTLKMILVSGYTPNIDTDQVYADVSGTEYGSSAGYTAGGETLGSQSVAQDNTNDRGVFDAADVTWTSLGPLSPATPSHAILYNDTPTSPADPLAAYWEIGSTATNGGNYTLQFHADGAILIT
jgi:hypothetical protein